MQTLSKNAGMHLGRKDSIQVELNLAGDVQLAMRRAFNDQQQQKEDFRKCGPAVKWSRRPADKGHGKG